MQAAAAAAVSQNKKPTSSVEADIAGGSTLSSQALPKQEASTASSKTTAFKTGIFILVTMQLLLVRQLVHPQSPTCHTHDLVNISLICRRQG